jgi:non-ribosomal peptide synthase protein (TIGR01720 family)
MLQEYPLGAGDRVLQKTPFSFDVSVWEFFYPLLAGAELVVARPEGHRDNLYLRDVIEQRQITTVHFVPSMLQAFLETPELERCRSLRRVLCSGEALPLELNNRFFSLLSCELHNLYGPTEASVEVSYWACRPADEASSVPIGRPIANTQLYVLDANLQPVPIGVAGELHIGGLGLARGYLGRPGLTAERFVPSPWGHPEGARPGARLYRTGDIARYRTDGAIEYLGRSDQQVKIRGFRIELGEIEALLLQHDGVRACAVLLREDAPGVKQLVAYLVPAGDERPDAQELRQLLLTRLPAYMAPSAFVPLAALPLTPSGKLDRQQLLALGRVELDSSEPFVAPQTSREQLLASLWAELLGLKQIGLNDNFVELGGDSILSIQIVARAHQLGLHLTPRHIFEHPTVAALAQVIVEEQRVEAEQGPVVGPAPLTPIQHWFFEQPLAERAHWNQALFLELRTPLDAQVLEQALQRLLLHHDALRLRFHSDEASWRQTNAPYVAAPVLTYLDLAGQPEDAQAQRFVSATAELQRELSLAEGPLLRAALFNLGEVGQRLFIAIHHLVVDGVSWRILLEDLQAVYRQLAGGQSAALPPKTTSFRHWAEQLQRFAQSPELREELSFWREQLQDAAPLPLDYPQARAGNTVASARRVSLALSPDDTRALLQQVPAVYRTQIDDLLLAALAIVLTDWAQVPSVVVDVERHGREELFEAVDLSRTVGWFTSIVPCALQRQQLPDLAAHIKSIKEQLRAIPRHGIGYGLLRYLCDDAEVRAQLAAQPAAQISFNYLGQLDQALPSDTPFALAREAVAPVRGPGDPRQYLLDVTASVVEGQLRVDWTYAEALYTRSTVERLADGFLEALESLIDHCLDPNAGGYTPSDFPEAGLSQEELDKLVSRLRLS